MGEVDGEGRGPDSDTEGYDYGDGTTGGRGPYQR